MIRGALVLNAGSSSLKYSLFDLGTPARPLRLDKGEFEHPVTPQEHLRPLLERVEYFHPKLKIEAVGHRIVHGGERYSAPVTATEEVLSALEELVPMAPLHQPQNLSMVRAAGAQLPGCPQILCFDTAFHCTQPQVAQLYGLPLEYYEAGVRRYGFHGLSYEFIAGEIKRLAPSTAGGRIIVAHLGNGVSLCGLSEGVSVATTMGFTALEGPPMGTRCGSLDPGVVLYLLAAEEMNVPAVTDLLYRQSGLKGMSGLTCDMRELLASDQPRARLAVDFFVYRVVREIGSLAAALGGLDGLVFTAGIGANSPQIRERVCAQLKWLGVELEEAANAAGHGPIGAAGSRVQVWALPTDEELMIARHCDLR